ncbi:MAG: FAD:protein FMN transferase [Lachnospiraceae bacterium]|nr:FAD:protein FMN transferase [Lachnospiraceae bacterium]
MWHKALAGLIGILFAFISLMTIFMGCGSTQPISKSDFVLDTIAVIQIYDKQDRGLLDKAFELCRKYERLFSATIATSDIGRLNRSEGKTVQVSDECFELLGKAYEYGKITDGIFDVTIYPVSLLWDFKSGKGKPPEKEAIEEALSHVDYRQIVFEPENNGIRLKDPKAKVDLGGIAKGYIADRIKDYLLSEGVKSAIINLGGNVLTIGANSSGKAFRIGIQKPFSGNGEVLDSLEVIDRSVVTSGSDQRFFRYEGRLYHHILDPRTGYPSDSGLQSVTIVSRHSLDGDALSTASFILGQERAEELLRGLSEQGGDYEGIEASFYP